MFKPFLTVTIVLNYEKHRFTVKMDPIAEKRFIYFHILISVLNY